MKVDITFTEKEVHEILRNHLINSGYKAGTPKTLIKEFEVGHQMNSHKEHRFIGVRFTSCEQGSKTHHQLNR